MSYRASQEGSYLVRTCDDDRYAWARRSTARRRLVLVEATLIGALVALGAVAAVVDRRWSTWYLVAWTVGLVAFIPLHAFLNLGIRGLYDRAGRTLDEHQRQLRDESYIAVRLPSIVLTFAAIAAAVATVARTGEAALGLAIGFLLWLGAGLLPYWHLAWILPDEENGS